MRSLKHLTPRYIWDRSLVWIYEHKSPNAPWLTERSIEILDNWLRPEDVGLEWGSGRSTRWFARRVAHLTSIEHNPAWHETVRHALPGNVDLRLISGIDHTAGGSDEYVGFARRLKDSSLDFALVDGASHLRDRCTQAILPKLKPGSLLIVDNVERYLPWPSRCPSSVWKTGRPSSPLWGEIETTLKGWRFIWTSNGKWDTGLFIKPSA